MKVAELEGALLDCWVARADGVNQARIEPHGTCTYVDSAFGINIRAQYSPSTQWAQGGPILEREGIAMWRCEDDWCAICPGPNGGAYNGDSDYIDARSYDGYVGRTPLIAAMRAYVASKFGEEVEDTAHNL